MKNFLSGVSVAVVSLLATTSPSSSDSFKALFTNKGSYLSKSLMFPRGGQSFTVSGGQYLSFFKRNHPFSTTSFAFPKGSPFFGGQSPVTSTKQPFSLTRGSQPFAATSFAFPKGSPFYGGPSPVAPEMQPFHFARGNQPTTATPVAFSKGNPIFSGQSPVASTKQPAFFARGSQPSTATPVAFSKGNIFFGGQSPVAPERQVPSLKDVLTVVKTQIFDPIQAARQQLLQSAQQQLLTQRRHQEEVQRRQQEVAQQREIAHQQEIARQVEAWNRLTPTERLFRTQFTRVTKPDGTPLERLNETNFQMEQLHAVDLGYGQGRSRTRQYSLNMSLPAAPVFHAYQPGDNLVGFSSPVCSVNFRLAPGYNNPGFAPAAVNGYTQGRDPNTTDYFVVAQDVPWDLDAAGGLQFRPQSYFDPESEYSSYRPISTPFLARIGVFSRNPGGPLIQGQVEDALLAAPRNISIHNGITDLDHPDNAIDVGSPANIALRARALANNLTDQERRTANLILANLKRANQPLTVQEDNYVRTVLKWTRARANIIGDPQLISSSNAHPLVNFNMNDSRVIWSVAERLDGNRRMAVTKHILLTPAHNAVLAEVLGRPGVNTYQDFQRELQNPQTRNRLVLGGGGNLADEFNIPVR